MFSKHMNNLNTCQKIHVLMGSTAMGNWENGKMGNGKLHNSYRMVVFIIFLLVSGIKPIGLLCYLNVLVSVWNWSKEGVKKRKIKAHMPLLPVACKQFYSFDIFQSVSSVFCFSSRDEHLQPPCGCLPHTQTDNSKLTGRSSVEGLAGKNASSFNPNLPLNKSQIYEHVSRRNPALICSFQAHGRNSEAERLPNG